MAALADHEMMRNQTASFGGITAVPARIGRAPGPAGIAGLAGLAVGLLLGAGCGKSEPKITGSRSAGPVPLACAWQRGYTYHLRLDTEIMTETAGSDPQELDRHRVTYGQECLVRVTNSPRAGNLLELEVEVTSLEMERAKNEGVALSFNSEQGGETVDDLGYIPVLKKMVGGRLRFAVSPSGKLVRFDGLTEWLNAALGPKAVKSSTTTTTTRLKTVIPQNPPGPAPAEASSEGSTFRRVEFQPGQTVTNVPGAAGRVFTALPANPPRPPSSGGDTVSRTLRGFFNTDLFRTFLEFRFLPAAAVRVGDEWKEQGDTAITSRNNRIKYDARCTFTGWQQHGGTNCARIDAVGKTTAQTPPGNNSNSHKSGRKSGMDGTVWVNTGLAFPATTILDKETVLPGDTNTRVIGTNTVTTTTGPKYIRERVTITLLKATPPPEAPATSAESSP